MLNPEYVDIAKANKYVVDEHKIGFTDSDGDKVVEIIVNLQGIIQLHKMLSKHIEMHAHRK